MPRPNFFFGFPIDGAFLAALPPLPKNFRLFHPEDVHLTLAFLGGTSEEAALRSLAALDERLAAEKPAPLDVSLGSVAPMGKVGAYTALSALLAEGRDAAATFITAHRDLLTETATGRREKRAAKPHVTLARPRFRATDADRAAGLEWAARVELGAVRATLDRVALYTWSAARRDQMFQVIAERRLGAK